MPPTSANFPVAVGISQLRLPNAGQKPTTNLVNEMFPVRLLFFFCCQSSCYEQFLVFGKCMAFYCAHCWPRQTTARPSECPTPTKAPEKPQSPTHRPSNQCHLAAFGWKDCRTDSASYTLRFRGAGCAHFTNAFRIFIYYVYLLPFVTQQFLAKAAALA